MQSRTLMSPVLGVAFSALSAITSLQAQGTPTVFHACYTRIGGVVYRIKEPLLQPPILRERCASADHVQFSWTSGVADHGLLTGLLDDDHTQYLLGNGTRALTGNLSLGGFTLTNLGAASANGQAVRFEQAVKTGDVAGGDLSGSYPNPSVGGLRGNPVASTSPIAGNVLTFDGTAWSPAAPPSGGGVTDHGLLSGLGDDDHPQYLLGNGVRDFRDGFAVTGSVGSGGAIPASNSGTRLMWYPRMAAFRAGSVDGAQWNDFSIGLSSTALGENTIASGQRSTALGWNTIASGQGSTALGFSTNASSAFSTALGNGTRASGSASTALGSGATASGVASTALGTLSTASGVSSTALGDQTIASGRASTAMGYSTIASGEASTAMGTAASTNDKAGTFVYGDFSTLNTGSVVMASADNQFMVRAAGGTIFYSNADLTAGVQLSPGGGAWASVSDRNRKENFHDEDGERVLAQIAHMPLQSWNYKAQAPAIRHLGPTAQDFYAAFQLGESDTTINTVDADGITLLAVLALERRTAELRRENEELRAAVARLEAMVRALLEARREGH